jgi:G3E family GTPase
MVIPAGCIICGWANDKLAIMVEMVVEEGSEFAAIVVEKVGKK